MLPSLRSLATGALKVWVTAAAAGKVGARPLAGRASEEADSGFGAAAFVPSRALSSRAARALLLAESPQPSLVPSPSVAPGAGWLAPMRAPAQAPAPATGPMSGPAAGPAAMPSTGVVLPVSVSGTQFVDGNGEQVFLLGVNLAANDACGVADRTTDQTLGFYRAYVAAMGINAIAQDIILTPSMANNPAELDVFIDIARRVQKEIPGLTLFVRPLTDVLLDERSAPTAAANTVLATLAGRARGLPLAISLGKELHRSHDDYANKLGNDAVNVQLRAALDVAYTAVRAANPDIMVLFPGLLDPQSGAQESRSAAGWEGHFGNYTNAAVAVDVYTTESTEAGQLAQMNSWALNHTQTLPVMVTEIAPYIDASLGVNTTERVFNQTFAALANAGTPTFLWGGEYECAPSMVDGPWNQTQTLSLNHWGQLAQYWIRSYIG